MGGSGTGDECGVPRGDDDAERSHPAGDAGTADPSDDAAIGGDDADEWPGLEGLPPTPPEEYPPSRPFRRRPDAPRPELPPSARGEEPDEPAPHNGSERRRRPLIAAVAAAMILVLIVAAVLVARVDRNDPEQDLAGAPSTSTTAPTSSTTAPPSTTTQPPEPTSTLPPLEPVSDPPLDAAVVEAAAFVAEQRGFPVGDPIPAVRQPDADFEARLTAQAMLDVAAIEGEGSMLKLQGVIDPDVDYVALYLSTYVASVGAYFDPASEQVVVRGEPGQPVSESLRDTLVHEVTHALDFRELDLYEVVFAEPDTERQFGFEALVEGDAMRIQHLWEAARGDGPAIVPSDGLDAVTARRAVAYVLGEPLVDSIVARGGEAELNAAFADPPTTSEQVIHPEKFAVREAPLPLDEPEADGEVLWSGVTGEYTTSQMLRSVLPPSEADGAAAGWGNDKGVLWLQRAEDGGLTCLRIAYVMDSTTDLAEIEDALARWVDAEPDRTAFRDGDTIVVTSCADVPPPPTGFGGEASPI